MSKQQTRLDKLDDIIAELIVVNNYSPEEIAAALIHVVRSDAYIEGRWESSPRPPNQKPNRGQQKQSID